MLLMDMISFLHEKVNTIKLLVMIHGWTPFMMYYVS